jgi:DNA invertase Pin-like site-specific DNA recombinase
MSTEHQRYSLENQAAAIAAYASDRGYEINRTYFDPGKSGLTLRERKGLQALLADALSANREFDAILVLDVSRWGRFQDPDQSAHYEYLCREAGVQVLYCGEPFENDGSAVSTLVKQLKRLMAAEYSRELSVKIGRARYQQAQMGFHQGGTRVYGVRRLVVDSLGRPRFLLERGARKALTTDRVVLVPGAPEQLAVIRTIFRRFVRDGRGLSTIGGELNARGVCAERGQPWNAHLVRAVLTHELMIGNYVFGRRRQQLKGRGQPNPPEQWVRVKVMDPIIPAATFQAAQRRLASGEREKADRRVLAAGLKRLLRTEGRLSQTLIDACPYLPCAFTFRRRFGSLAAAYRAVGYRQPRTRWSPDGRAAATSEELLDLLRATYRRNGYITGRVIDDDPGAPSSQLISKRFGGLLQAYALAELPSDLQALQQAGYRRSVVRGTAAVVTGALKRRKVPAPAFDRQEMVESLRRIQARRGYVTASLIAAEPRCASPSAFIRYFGSLYRAYELAGLECDPARLRGAARRRGWQTRSDPAALAKARKS